MFETLRKPGPLIVKSATIKEASMSFADICRSPGQARGGEAEIGGGEESEGELSSLSLLLLCPFSSLWIS
jgi:hypothetical protein